MADDDLDLAIGARIKELRIARGLTLDELANASAVSRAMISRIERAEASPTASLLSRLCAALGLSLSAFFAEEDKEVSPLARRDQQAIWRDPGTGYVRRAVSPPGTESKVDVGSDHQRLWAGGDHMAAARLRLYRAGAHRPA